jgi:hypothetical protein
MAQEFFGPDNEAVIKKTIVPRIVPVYTVRTFKKSSTDSVITSEDKIVLKFLGSRNYYVPASGLGVITIKIKVEVPDTRYRYLN